MATYKPIRKTASGTEEIKIPYAVLADAPDLSKFVKTNTANTFTETQGIADGKHLKTNLIKSADDSKWIAEITAAGLEIGGSGTPLRFYSSTRPVVANQNKELAYTSDIPAAVTESTVSGWGFTKNTGTITGIKMNGSSKGTSGVVDLGTVITAHQDISGKQDKITSTAKLPASLVSGLAKVATSGSYNDLSNTPTIPTVNNGTLTIQKNGTNVQTFTANQNSSVTANITVPTKASDVNALSLDGGTINKSKTVKMDASANSNGANLKWGTVNSKNPYIGYASDQTDGTFVVGSLLGTNYASGLAIGGGSGNLLWKGAKVATTSDIPDISGKLDKSAFSLSGTTLTITI